MAADRPAPAVTIEELLREAGPDLGMRLRAGAAGLARTITVPRIQKPGLALAGYAEQLHRDRVQTLGATEIEYLQSVAPATRALGIDTVMAASPACVVVTRDLEPPAELVAASDQHAVPLAVSRLASAEFIAGVTQFLQAKLSPSTSIHGVLLDILGIGVLLLGKSGIGKSEAALDLVARGHRLVADDIVNIRRIGPKLIYGSGSGIIRHHMEVRGLGIINIQDLFGISAVRDVKKIELVIELSDWDQDAEYDRLGVDDEVYSILGEILPLLRVPVRPGRNVATIIEVAARNQLLKFMGHHSAREFQDRLNQAIADARPRRFDADLIE
ncbi:MAG TPA: HPr(Ser) kinase/phosphatase [Kofleriaceae bacterium]|nr:HPr(Ser) kinase/phosphatase [Kofleriaceae bacterium]